MKTAIIYYSKHHGNTEKLLNAIKENSDDSIVLIDMTQVSNPHLESYDRIGYASGIYYSKFNKQLIEFASKNTPHNKEVFFIYTCGQKRSGYTKAIQEALADKNCQYLGEYGCLGFNTFGPLKLIGGMCKGHPTSDEIEGAVKFYNSLKNEDQ